MRKIPTKEELIELYLKQKLGIKKVAKILGYSHEGIKYRMRLLGIKIRNPTHTNHLRGKKSPFWKGGKTILKGYKFMRMPEHPQANSAGYVSLHRLNAEKKVGRPLLRGEHVHHIDGDKQNNKRNNLYLCFAKKHRELENELISIAMQFVRIGKIKFQKEHYILCAS